MDYLLTNAINRIIEIDKTPPPIIKDYCGRQYTTIDARPLKEPALDTLEVNTLSAIINYIGFAEKNEGNFDINEIIIHVASEDTVVVKGTIFGDFMQRQCWLRAINMGPKYNYGNWIEHEMFVINLQCMFIETESRNNLLKLISNLKIDSSIGVADNGIDQKVTAKTGITRVGEVDIINPLRLKPYSTFLEIDQPERIFVFRMKSSSEGGSSTLKCSLIEADGGAWKIEAKDRIRAYLENSFNVIGACPVIIS